MKLGILGLPSVGKSTLFNALTKAGVQTANHPFSTIEPNVGIVMVPDVRLERLTKMYNPKKTTPATIEFIDIAGLVSGSIRGEGLGNRFLAHIREVDAIIHTIRCFENENVMHLGNKIDPLNDIEIINLELILTDIESLEKKIRNIEKLSKNGDNKIKAELTILEHIKESLEKDILIRNMQLSQEEQKLINPLSLLTAKPVIYAVNISEKDIGKDILNMTPVQRIIDYAGKENSEVVVICAKIEEEIAQLDDEEKGIFLQELGIGQSGLDRLIKSSYKLLGLISFLTVGRDEVRAWTIKKGDKAPKAAAKIHTDFERGFIRAEIIPSDILLELGSYSKAKENGLVRLEGKEYIINDGDVVEFRFNI
ncbi:MAG: redox-regulated ATPase YchF [Actinobacteria bacterium]|nr:redox-regulated ATPase YchF [Actinomycetota bacterium]